MTDQISLNYEETLSRFSVYQEFYKSKNIPNEILHFDTNQSISYNLKHLAIVALDSQVTASFLFALDKIFLDFVSRWISDSSIEYEYLKSRDLHTCIRGSVVLSALSRIISLAPEIAPLVEYFLDNNDLLSQLDISSAIKEGEVTELLLAYYRLLYFDHVRFQKFISPEILSSILKSNSNSANKYLAIELLSEYTDLAEKTKNDMIKNFIGDAAAETIYENDPNVDYRFIAILEAQRQTNFKSILKSFHFTEKSHDKYIYIDSSLLSQLVVSVCGILVPKIHFDQPFTKSSDFVSTERSVSILRDLAHNVQHSKPVMLIGNAGSGKTFIINELSKYLSCEKTIVKIHLGDQTDAKLLLGTYTSGQTPGTFEWRSGILTTAVKEGRWVLIEDIDKAPTEVLSILLTLLEKRELTIPSRGEVIKAANGFQLISTIRTSNTSKKTTIPDLIGLRLWKVLHLKEQSQDELSQILEVRYPVLRKLIPMFLQLYDVIRENYQSKSFLILNKGSHPRAISVRDLVKFCKRVNIIFENHHITDTDQLLESNVVDSIFAEAVDCFASAISETAALIPLTNSIGEALQIAPSRVKLFLEKHVPIYEDFDDKLVIGRAHLKKAPKSLYRKKNTGNNTSFARTNHSLRLMEQIGVSVQLTEPVLLVGETGTGKTTVVQQVAKQLNKHITVINVSQQTEIGDLLGGFKPVNTKSVAAPIQESFLNLFHLTFSSKKNEKFERMLTKCFNRSQWKNVIKLWNEAVKSSTNVLTETEKESLEDGPKKKRRLTSNDKALLLNKWQEFQESVSQFEVQAQSLNNSFVFDFVEGSLVQAVRNGDWLLLDEINLASSDTLESISDLLSDIASQRTILLSEKGEVESIRAHKDFRIFGCMNPATDVGKRDLPLSIRSRFTEIYVHSPDGDIADLLQIIDKYVGRHAVTDEWVGNDIAQLYLEAKKLSESNQIVDGANQKPHFSIRTLTRTLLYVVDIVSIYGLRRSLFEGFSMSFLTLLDQKSEVILKPLIEKYTIGRLKNPKSVINQIPPSPPVEDGKFVQFRHYWMKEGSHGVVDQPHYIITPYVEKNMLNLVRASSGKRFPILVQGPTSSGKTSMIKYLADITGNKFVRINNHEHTDLQEYLGTYISDSTGKLSFKEGVLVEALRKGHWLVLDELNLAPTDVLEALNRLLDDNRELFIPETQEVVHPHPDFMLFATQNPPGLYGGRKVLSRAFRNRFLELHFDDIPQSELEIILRERCQIAPTYAKKIVEVYRQLSVQRQSSRLFEQKNSFATLRDLFRWALREAVGYEQLAANGYMLLAERVRKPEEKLVVKEILEKVMKVKLDMDDYYNSLENKELLNLKSSIVWTKAIRRLAVLISTSLSNNEPILLVGETGCGKTTVCQLLAQFNEKRLITVNAHQNTETGDLLGAQRPVRNKSGIQEQLLEKVKSALSEFAETSGDLDELLRMYDSSDLSTIPETLKDDIKSLRDSLNVLFEWSDGPLIQALKEGQYFLLDEISLADDSVLERLNSVLEPERSLLLAEKGSDDSSITASEGFQFLATMNPGGDYGKKELSPALRNRFTEIWVPSMEDLNDVLTIVQEKLDPEIKEVASVIVEFSEKFGKRLGGNNISSGVISLRDILAWVEFLNSSYKSTKSLNGSLLHGAAMVFIDALGTNNTAHLAESQERLQAQKLECVEELSQLVGEDLIHYYTERVSVELQNEYLRVGLFKLARNSSEEIDEPFSFKAPTTAGNAMRVVRALQLTKPIMLEGSPGVGKTSLVSALAKSSGNPLTRINLSEQTDLVDLFGSDAPVEGGKTGEFSWRDAPFLRAMKEGEWVLLDEMNLASQSVLEGLNACLDHRGEVYIPELDKSFPRHPNFLVFAAQNPQYQGGGRKGLPKSFINRFSVVYVDTLTKEDLVLIASHIYPEIDSEICSKMIEVVSRLEEQVTFKKEWGTSGGPWEFNLRDTLRWLDVYQSKALAERLSPVDFMDIIVCQRFRSDKDRSNAREIVLSVFDNGVIDDSLFAFGDAFIQAKKALFPRSQTLQVTNYSHLNHLQSNTSIIESSLLALQHAWPLIFVGPTNSGKTELVRYLSSITGSKVVEFAMNSDIDSMDILGGYEQSDLTRKITSLIEKLTFRLKLLIASFLKSSVEIENGVIESFSLLKFITENTITVEGFHDFVVKFKRFITIINEPADFADLVNITEELTHVIEGPPSVRFEWFDGLLVKAVEEGHWLVLDNANLCSPSVLDRLNSLLEINGSLIINECSMANGQPRILKPHKNFRLFLTMDPKFGELSRAMRNRGVEIFIDALDSRSTSFDQSLLDIEVDHFPSDITEISYLSVTDSKRLPTSKFVKPTDSFSYYLGLVLDTIYLNPKSESINKVLTTIIPFFSQLSMKSLNSTITSSSEFPESIKTSFNELLAYINHFTTTGITKSIHDLYYIASEKANELAGKVVNFEVYQSLNPLWNSFVYSIVNNEDTVASSELIYFFDLLASLYDSLKKLEMIELKGSTGKINELTYVEQGAAIESGRNIKNSPRLNVYRLLRGIYDFIISIISELTAEQIIQSKGVFHSLSSIVLIWNSLLESSSIKNDAKTRVYQKMIANWSSKSEDLVKVDELNMLLDSFENDLKLNRGYLMTPIWEKFRGLYPQSADSWEVHGNLKELMLEFDKVTFKQFSDSEELVTSLGSAILGLEQEIISQPNDSTEIALEKLKTGVKTLDEISSKFLIQRSHNFEESFCFLFNFVVSDTDHMSNDLLTLSQYAGLGVSAISSFENNVYPKVFDRLWLKKGSHFKSLTPSLFSDHFFQHIFSNIENYVDFSGDQLDQTVQDSIEFSKQLIKNSQSVLLDRLQQHKDIITKWYCKILSIFNIDIFKILEGDWNDIALNAALVEASEVNNEPFQKVQQSFFVPALLSLASTYSIGDIGQAWVFFSIGLIQLYVPNVPNDPAIEDHILYENFERRQAACESLSESLRSIRSIFFGDDSILIEKYAPTVDTSETPEKPRVYRTKLSIDNLFEEWQSFMSSTVDLNSLISFLEKSEDAEIESFEQQLDLFQQNTSNFMDRLQSHFSLFSDVNDIFKGYIFGLKLGFDLILEDRRQTSAKYQVSPLWFINAKDLTTPESFDSSFEQIQELTKSIDVDSSLGEEILSFLMKFILNKFGPTNHNLEQVWQTLYYRWALRRTRKEQAEAEAGSLFKYKDDSESDEEFKSMFPDYEEFLVTGESANIKRSNELESQYLSIANGYIDVFVKKNSISLDSILFDGSRIVKKLLPDSNEFRSTEPNATILAAAIKRLNDSIDSTRSTSAPGTSVDFYFGHSSFEMKRSVNMIQKLLKSVKNLLAQWPEHATLSTLDRICYEYLAFPVKTPLAKLIQKIEQIYTFISEWEKYASVKVSLKSHFDELTGLIVSWRKLELSSWNSLFKKVDDENLADLGGWWFNLFETIILPISSGEKINLLNLVSAMNIFISKSTYGQFKARLELLKAFTLHAITISEDKELLNALNNISTYYDQFIPTIDEHLISSKKKLQKDVQEVILLASWKDVNIDALKQSSRRSHHNLYKLVRKYRDLLATEVTSLIEQGISSEQKVSVSKGDISMIKFNALDIEEHKSKLDTKEIWINKPSHLKNFELISKNMKVYGENIKGRLYPDLYEFVLDIVKEMDRLKSETPKVYKEENKKVIAALKTQKRKLLSDTIKELRRFGLKYHLREDIHKMQSSATLILSGSASFTNTVLENSDIYFFRLIDLLPRLKASISELAEDVPVNDAEKGIAIIEHFVSYLIKNRTSMVDVAINYRKLEDLMKLYESAMLVSGDFKSQEDFATSSTSVKQMFKWLPQIIDFAISISSISAKMTQIQVDNGVFQALKLQVQELEKTFNSNWNFSSSVAESLIAFENELKNSVTTIENWKVTNPTLSFVGDIVINWVQNINSLSVSESEISTSDITTLDKTLSLLSSKILVIFQRITEIQTSPEIVYEDDKWFTTSQKELNALVKGLYSETIVKLLAENIEYLKFNSLSSENSQFIKSLLALTQPFVKGYCDLVTIILNKLKNNYIEIGRSTYVMATTLYNLAKNGFCSPEPPSEAKQDDNLQDGTGLGDGEGASNNSNDVEDDEDLSEQAQEPNKEKDENKDEEDDNEDAVDIEGDMAGDLENLSDQEKSDDQEDEEDKEEEEELDEEIDDLDDLDPNAVDDKMWDEEAKEDKKEKESDNMPENSKADDVEAKDDEEPSESKDNNAPEDQEQSQDQEDQENDDEGDEEEDVGEQEDEVKNQDGEELDQNVPETETLDLPDDINLDSGDEEDDKEDQEEDMDDGLDDDLNIDDKVDEKEDQNDEEEDQEMKDSEEADEINEDAMDIEEEDNQDNEEEDNQGNEESTKDDENQEEETSDNEELNNNEGNEEQQDEANEDGDQLEGIDGADTGENNDDNIDMETAVEQQSGEKGDGAQAQADQEREDVGESGSANYQEQNETQDGDTNDDARDSAKESLKQLGDSLKEFHRRHQEIKEASEKDENSDQNANERPDEFEHVEGENTNTDTQALGAANKDQVSSIDEDKAIDDDIDEEIKPEEEDVKTEGDEVNDSDIEENENKDEEIADDSNGKTKGGFIGERKQESTEGDDMIKTEIKDDEYDEDEDMISNDGDNSDSDDVEYRDIDEARELWRKSELETQELASSLSEQLRLILEPTLSTKLKGDYKTGKRLNMKRIIPYIASDFRKDKIWLRRTKPSKRQYQIMISVDDSKSMSESKSVDLAFQSIYLVSKALTQLESGGLSIVKFGEDAKVIHPFDKQFTSESGARIFQRFDFQQTRTNIRKLVSESIKIFTEARGLGDADLWQLQIIISDGVCEDHETIERLVRRAREEKIMLVFVIIDGINSNESIMDMSQVRYVTDAGGNMVLKVDKYLDSFPFEFYVVVHDISELPKMLSLILRQYFSELASV